MYRLLSTAGNDLETSGLAKSHPRVINSRFDHVVIPLANAFRPTYIETLDALSTLIEQLTVPVTVLGVGEQASLNGVYKGADSVKPATIRFVRAVLEHSPSIGVRGERDSDYLNSLGFGDEHVKVIGCPSMFMYGPDLNVEKKVESLSFDSAIALNVSPYVPADGSDLPVRRRALPGPGVHGSEHPDSRADAVRQLPQGQADDRHCRLGSADHPRPSADSIRPRAVLPGSADLVRSPVSLRLLIRHPDSWQHCCAARRHTGSAACP